MAWRGGHLERVTLTADTILTAGLGEVSAPIAAMPAPSCGMVFPY